MKTLVSKSVLLGFALVLPMRTAAQTDCGQLVINALDLGSYDANGNHDPGNDNYFCGDGNNVSFYTAPLRNWFAFSIPVLTQQVSSASLRVRTFYIISPTGSETYQLRDVSTAVSTLRAGGTGLMSIYADLGDGAIYASRVFSTNESFQSVSIPLNGVFVSNLAAATGTELAIGGEITTLDGIPDNNEQVFSGSSGGPDSAQLVLTFANPSPLAITVQPQSRAVPAGTNISLHVQACGSSVLGYQWQFNGINIPGANNDVLSLFNVMSNNAGPYRVVVTNLSGTVTSAVATLTVNYAAPTAMAYAAIGTSPAYVGNSITLCANVSGIPFPTLQWQFSGTNLPGQNNLCLLLSDARTNQSGDYRIVASNAISVVTSAVVSLVVTTRPPVSAYFFYGQSPSAVGSSAALCAEVNITPFPSLQWRLNGTNLPNETNGCLYFSPVDANDAGVYTIIASNISGVHTSPPLALAVYHQPPGSPFLYFAHGSPAALAGNDLTLCSSVGGSPPLSYHWRFNDMDLPGQNASCLSLLQLSTNQAGNYTLVVSNVAGIATSAVVAVTVDYQPPIFAFPSSGQTVVEGSTVRLPLYALGGPPPAHVLQFNGTNLAVPFTYDNNNGGFTLLDVTLADAGNYQVIASNSLGVATSQVATLTITPAGPLDRWTQRNPLPQSQRLYSIAYGNGLFVAVGDRGTVLTSADGTNWFPQSRRADLSLFGVASGGGLFAAVGDEGTILMSADGTNWIYRYSAPSPDLNAVAYGNGRFVAVGDGPSQTLVLSSADGVTWEKVTVSSVSAELGIAFGNGTFVAVGSSTIMTSTNGLDWSVAKNSLTQELEGVSFLENQFIALGDNGSMFVSSDGVSWNSRNPGTTRRLLGVTYANGQFVAAGVRGVVLTSPDTITWTAAVSGTPDRLETIAFANDLFIAAGENGTTITSTNGTAWAKQNFGITRDLDGMAVANGTVVIVGKGGSILTSTDGAHYTPQDAGVTNDLHGLAWANGLWVAVGEPGIILTSSNAIQWTSRTTGNTNSLKGATYGNGEWVVVGTEGSVITSPDGVNWSATVTSPPYDLNDVAYGNGRFVIAADGLYSMNGSAFVSSNGLAWTLLNSFYPNKNLRSILFTNGIFFVVGNDGSFFTSTNGLNWSTAFINFFGGNLRAATLAHGLWIVVGNNGAILTSTNLSDWTRRPTRTFENLHEVVYLNGKLITIGNRGTILQSDRFIAEWAPLRYEPGIGATIGLKSIRGRGYRLDASTDLLQWTNLIRFTNAAEQTFFTDTNAVAYPYRFYRVVAE